MAPPSARNVTQIETEITALASAHSKICTEVRFAKVSREKRDIRVLRITAGASGTKPVALVIGGVHSREFAPPDAVLSFAQRLVEAYDPAPGPPPAPPADAVYPAFTDATGASPIPYEPFKIFAADIRAIVETLEIYIIPLVNPDGRYWCLKDVANQMWRKNRRPHPAGGDSIGVDINRNFNIIWDFEKYYNATAGFSASKLAIRDNYVGDAAASEPETAAVQSLIDTKKVAFFCDVHSSGRKILYPWSMETDQTTVSTKNFANAAWDRGGPLGGRDGSKGTFYEEFISNAAPHKVLDDLDAIGKSMAKAILTNAGADAEAKRRSIYAPEVSATLYPSSGDSSDYAFSRGLTSTGNSPVRSFTIECGSDLDGENGFHPDYPTKFPKIEREVHSALYALLKEAVARSPKPAPSPAPSPKKSGGPCLFVLILGASGLHTELAQVRARRDRMVAAPGWRGSLGRRLHRSYQRVAPRITPYLQAHPRARELVRVLLVSPVVKLVTGRHVRRS